MKSDIDIIYLFYSTLKYFLEKFLIKFYIFKMVKPSSSISFENLYTSFAGE